MTNFSLSYLDIGIMVGYAILIIAYGLYHGKRKNSEEYFLAGRNMVWPIVGISLFAANISSSTLVGLASSAYETDTHVFNYEWLAAVVLIFFAIFFLPFYLKSKVYTMPEFLERRYDQRSRYYFSFITIVGNVLIDTAAGLYVGNIVLKLMFPEIPGAVIIIVLAFAAAAYTIPGGLNSVIQTEVVQAILLILGSCLITYYAFAEVGGWSGLIAGLDAKAAAGEFVQEKSGIMLKSAEEVLSLVRPANDDFMPWTGLLFGAPILGFYFWANNQFMVQRVLGAKDLNHGRWGALFAGLLKLPVLFIMVLPGTCAILMFADLDLSSMNYALPDGSICQDLADCPNATYPLLLFNLLPTGALGLVLAGLLAAMMSSVSATFNSASTLVTMDFVRKLRPEMTSQQLVRAGQITTLVLVVLASAWAPQIEKFGSLWEYLQDILSYIAPPVAATFILGLFWKRATGTGSIACLLFGFVFSIFAVLSKTFDWVEPLNNMHFLHRTFFLFMASILVNFLVSLGTKVASADQIEQYTWKKQMFIEETEELKALPWYKNYRYLSIGLLILTALLVGYFW
ncbi:MAG: sodium:solute symporter [Saprospiraceae bacterium]|nr:sodium:solute symporter [Saprospiraceae bacterium]